MNTEEDSHPEGADMDHCIPEKQQENKVPYSYADTCGFHFNFCFEITGCDSNECDIFRFISSGIQSVYPIGDDLSRSFSKKILSTLKGLHDLRNNSGSFVELLVEWRSFALLILRSESSIPADIRIYVNSREFHILL